MGPSNLEQNREQKPPFTLDLIDPYRTFNNGAPPRIPYIVDGLLTQGGFSVLGGKPKHGKSSMARYEAVCVAKGLPFLGRKTTKGEVILISLEDPLGHVDNCLNVLGYDPATDARILIVDHLAPSINESIDAIEKVLADRPKVRLVIVDTLAKLLRVSDLNDYMPVLSAVEKLHDLARKFPHLHIQGVAHSKKIKTDDPFDSLLGSTALRGEPDTNIALYDEDREHVIATETRVGRDIPPSILRAELVESAGADVVKNFSVNESLTQWQEEQTKRKETKSKSSYEDRIIAYLKGCEGRAVRQQTVLDDVEGRREAKIAAIENLTKYGVLTVTGEKRSPSNPLALQLDQTSLCLYSLGKNKEEGIN